LKKLSHILFITPGFPANEKETETLTYLTTFIKYLKQSNPKIMVTIVALRYPFVAKKYDWFGCNVIALGAGNGKLKLPIIWLKGLKALSAIHKSNKVDIVNSLWLKETCLIASRFCKKNEIPHVCTAIGTEVVKGKFLHSLPLHKLTVVFLSQFHKKQFAKKAKEKLVISFGYNNHNATINKERTIDVIGVGWLTKLKNYDLFIDVMHELTTSRPTIKACIIGGGEEEKHLRTKIERLNLAKNIELTGTLKNEEVHLLLNKAKVLLHPSSFESQGFVFSEAQNFGLSIVSKKVGVAAASERWKIAENKLEMVKAVEQLLQLNYPLNSINNFDVVTTNAEYLELYHKMLAK